MSPVIRWLPFASLLLSCGAEAPPPKAATSAAPEQPEGARASSLEPQTPKEPKKASCTDGSCFSCGEAICLAGYYCAVGKSSHGCAWAPACVSRPTCACLAASLRQNPTCRCEEKDNGTFVYCEGAKL